MIKQNRVYLQNDLIFMYINNNGYKYIRLDFVTATNESLQQKNCK